LENRGTVDLHELLVAVLVLLAITHDCQVCSSAATKYRNWKSGGGMYRPRLLSYGSLEKSRRCQYGSGTFSEWGSWHLDKGELGLAARNIKDARLKLDRVHRMQLNSQDTL
jgi:hypothetical protein